MADRTKVVIIGAGFGGLDAAKALRKSPDVDVVIVDRHPYQLFSPLLYQVATGALPEDDIAYPVRAAIPGVEFIRGDVVRVDPEAHRVRLYDGTQVSYDQLIIATGSVGTTFGIPGVEEHALQMKTIAEARHIKKRILNTYEDVQEKRLSRDALRVVVVGGGPTGLEVSGAVAELQSTMKREYPEIASYASVTLVEAGPRLLPSFKESSSAHAKEEVEELGVTVKLNAAVDRMYANDVHLKSGEILPAGTIIWAAGVAAPEQWSQLGTTGPSRRLVVDDCLRLPGVPDVWVIGDTAAFTAKEGDPPLPMVAPVAMQMGRHAARSIVAQVEGKPVEPFRYVDKGQMATIGRRRAVVETPQGIKLHGTLAWLAWLGLHVVYLAGGRNRVSVLADWAWNYVNWGIGPRRAIVD
ncbi:MAG: NAD(P)/FAD-dependent oxidoreductase [Actinomycetales bacterium]|nr:NAD(P)/FAD-dependent oxidoreductase [Actinomycetales bacterium]